MWIVRERLTHNGTVLDERKADTWEAARAFARVIALRVSDVTTGTERRTWLQVASYLGRRLPRDCPYSKEAFGREVVSEESNKVQE